MLFTKGLWNSRVCRPALLLRLAFCLWLRAVLFLLSPFAKRLLSPLGFYVLWGALCTHIYSHIFYNICTYFVYIGVLAEIVLCLRPYSYIGKPGLCAGSHSAALIVLVCLCPGLAICQRGVCVVHMPACRGLKRGLISLLSLLFCALWIFGALSGIYH